MFNPNVEYCIYEVIKENNEEEARKILKEELELDSEEIEVYINKYK